MNHREIVCGEFFKPHRNSAIAFDALKEVLDKMTLFVHVLVERTSSTNATNALRNMNAATLSKRLLDDSIGIVTLIGDDVRVLHAVQQCLSLGYVGDLPFGEVEMNRISEGVDTSVNFCARPSARVADTLRPFFFNAPLAS